MFRLEVVRRNESVGSWEIFFRPQWLQIKNLTGFQYEIDDVNSSGKAHAA